MDDMSLSGRIDLLAARIEELEKKLAQHIADGRHVEFHDDPSCGIGQVTKVLRFEI